MPGCDGCTACCKIMQVRELSKPGNVWCAHCRIGAGCGIYDTRPESCRTFECVWLQTQHGRQPLAPELRPDASRVVIYTTDNGNTIVLHVAPDRPDAWKHGEMGKLVSRMLADGLPVILKCGNKMEKLQ
jgi:hypothetical protein